jgi:hypothetical protein
LLVRVVVTRIFLRGPGIPEAVDATIRRRIEMFFVIVVPYML